MVEISSIVIKDNVARLSKFNRW